MITFIRSLAIALGSLFTHCTELQHEILILRHRLNLLRHATPRRVPLTNLDRWRVVLSYRAWPGVLCVITILRPETIVRWHRQGFRA